MKRRTRNQSRRSVRFFSGLFFVAGLVVLALIGASLGKETYKKKQIQKEIEGLQSDIRKMNQENSELDNLVSYLSTQEFQEKEAREKLNLQKENEKIIILKKEAVSGKLSEEENKSNLLFHENDKAPNWKKWLDHFFGSNS